MKIFSLLGTILDGLVNDTVAKTRNDNDTVSIEAENINTYIPQVINNDKVILNFRYNSKYNNRGELFSIVVITSNNVMTTYEVGEKILSEISQSGLDEIYFSMCEEIML